MRRVLQHSWCPVQESAVPAASPSSAFLLDAMNVSGLGNSGMPNYLRGSNMPETSLVNAETPAWPDEDSLQSAVTGTGNPIATYPPDGAQPSIQASAGPSPVGAKPGAADRVPSGTLTMMSDAMGITEKAQRTFSRGPTTPRGAVDPSAAAPLDADLPGTSTAPTPTRGGPSQGAGGAGVSSQIVVGPAAVGVAAAKKKKPSEMTKAERRAMQEEQRAQKNSKGPQGWSPSLCSFCGAHYAFHVAVTGPRTCAGALILSLNLSLSTTTWLC